MQIARDLAAARELIARLPRPVGLVPTMGALHAGHLALVAAARARCASVVVTIFVNPLQFGPDEDFGRYPRAFAGDTALLADAGAALVVAPTVEAMYPPGFATAVDPGPLGTVFEGALRPGHFRGVATVCVKLFAATGADDGFFGEKDAQQLAVLRRIVVDLDLPIRLHAVPTVREADGLALSSRNVYLSAAERAAAPALYRALRAIADTVEGGTADETTVERARRLIVAPLREAYLAAVDPGTFAPQTVPAAPCIVIGSAQLSAARLIDNIPLGLGA